jgi:hypothetical protein
MTIEYKPDALKKIIEHCEEVILPVAEAHEKEWEEWEKKSSKEIKALDKEVDIRSLRDNFKRLKLLNWGYMQEVVPITYKFLWWKWERSVTRYTHRKTPVVDYLKEISYKLGIEPRGSIKLESSPLSPQYYEVSCKKYKRWTYILGQVLSESNTPVYIYLIIKGTIPCPSAPKDKYTNNIAFLKQAKMLVNLPSSEGITLSEDQGGELNDLLKTVYKLEEDNG